ncbi:hypothetical protein GF385_01960 [Candidatus Dependentiae bacterium]|nr:hypothetical protein [Candidatus Dependentiae bacterium]
MIYSKLDFWRPFGRLKIFTLILLLFSSCGQKKSEKNVYVFNSLSKNVPDYFMLNEAKYSDMPVPLGFKYVKQSSSDFDFENKSDFLTYKGSLDLISTLEFYYKTLEREGWQIEDLSNNCEGLLFCSKPSKKCIVSLRKLSKNKTKIYLFVKNKEDRVNSFGDINSKNITELKEDFDQDFTNKKLAFSDFAKG